MSTTENNYALRVFEACTTINSAKNASDLQRDLVGVFASFGLDHLTILPVPRVGRSVFPGMLVNTRPTEWLQRYDELKHAKWDPPVVHLQRSHSIASWNDLRASGGFCRKGMRIMNEASDCGANDGLTIPTINYAGS